MGHDRIKKSLSSVEVRALAGAAVLAVLATGSQSLAQAIDFTVYLRRAGPVRVGMTLRQVRERLGDPLAHLEGAGASLDECAYLTSSSIPDGLGLMFAHGRVVRVDVSRPGIRTASGVAVGTTEGEVQRTYPSRIRVEPHKYDPAGHYLRFVTVDPQDQGFGMVFETDGSRVTSFRTGTREAIDLVERCG